MKTATNLYKLGEFSPSLPSNDDYWIAPDARVIGQVKLGEGVSSMGLCPARRQ